MADLPRPVGPEIEEHHRVAGTDGADCRAVIVNDNRGFHEFVADSGGVTVLNGFRGGTGLVISPALHQHTISLFHPVPAFIPVHGVKAAAYGCDPAASDIGDGLFKLGQIITPGVGRRIAAVHETMDENTAQALAFGQLQQGAQMLQVAVNAAVGDQSQQVQGAAVRFRFFAGVDQGFIAEKAALPYILADHGQVLIDDAPCAYIHVANFRIAHLAFGQSHVQTGGGETGVGIGLP